MSLRLSGVSYAHPNGQSALQAIDLQVAAGEQLAIIGPSGAGKTTLLRLLAGFDRPDEGEIRIRGQRMNEVPPNRRPVNMVFQHLALFPTMTVGDNIAYGLKRQKVPAAERRRRVAEVLEQGYRTADIVSDGLNQVGCQAMGELVLAQLAK